MTKKVILLTVFLSTQSLAQTAPPSCTTTFDDRTITNLLSLHGEVADCIVFYNFRKRCAPPDDPKIMQSIEGAIKELTSFSYQIGKGICMTDEAMVARLEVLYVAAREIMNNSCVNFAALYKPQCRRNPLRTFGGDFTV